MTVDRKALVDRDWLRAELVALFTDAAHGGDKPEHPVCVKYAELLYKLLEPSTGGRSAMSDLDAIRRSVLEQDDEDDV